jgi:hypothetical protein
MGTTGNPRLKLIRDSKALALGLRDLGFDDDGLKVVLLDRLATVLGDLDPADRTEIEDIVMSAVVIALDGPRHDHPAGSLMDRVFAECRATLPVGSIIVQAGA